MLQGGYFSEYNQNKCVVISTNQQKYYTILLGKYTFTNTP